MITKTIYKYDGSVIETDCKDAVAKLSFNDESKHGRYYVKFHNGIILNVNATEFKRQQKDAKYRQVNKTAFEYYVKFITGKGETFLREAERAL